MARTASRPAPAGPTPVQEVLWEEWRALQPGVLPDAPPPSLQDACRQAQALAGDHQLAALCLSGGGIRSATFNLGVLQALARARLLPCFHYLSSVSGGGYVAGWLRAWMHRSTPERALSQLGGTPGDDPRSPEPGPVAALREYSNYLTPRLGLLSADTWTVAAIYVRNLLLNWLVILPCLAALVSIPQGCMKAVTAAVLGGTPVPRALVLVALGASFVAALWASLATYHLRRVSPRENVTEGRVTVLSVVPLVVSAVLLATAAMWAVSRTRTADGLSSLPARVTWPVLLGWFVIVPVIGWMYAELRRPRAAGDAVPFHELFALLGSGVLAACLLALATDAWLAPAVAAVWPYVVFALPAMLGVYLVARTLFVAMENPSWWTGGGGERATSIELDREWWARLSAWVLLIACGWIVCSGLCVLADLLRAIRIGWPSEHVVAAVGGGAGVATNLLARGRSDRTGPNGGGRIRELLLYACALLFLLCLIGLLSRGTELLERALDGLFATELARVFGFVVLAPLLLVLLSGLAGALVDVNAYSLHGLYKNRLVRAWLGASNESRRADRFTGFDPRDDLPLHVLGRDRDGAVNRPLPIFNATLNLVRGRRLAWQERKAESFAMTPLFCGNYHEGYRRAEAYGGPDGITLGTAVTISGAAANPNMGCHSSPLVSLVLTLFNGRLGSWLANVNEKGTGACQRAGPRHALSPLVSELLGWTDSDNRYINLSDGGHFDNLGLYEVVLRRCRVILVIDAGRDGDCSFEDLGNAIRKIRIDFGIPIAFESRISILPRTSPESPSGGEVGLFCAVGTVDYAAADGVGAAPGRLVYVKPALAGSGAPLPYDVYSYARVRPDFPHETTADQWFSESQFESYRALGHHVMDEILGRAAFDSLDQALARIATYAAPRPPGPPPGANGGVTPPAPAAAPGPTPSRPRT